MRVYIQQAIESGHYRNFPYEADLHPRPDIGPLWHEVLHMKPSPLDSDPNETRYFLHKGFFDSHLHLSWIGEISDHILLKGLKRPEEMGKLISQRLHNKNTSSYFEAFGWDESLSGLDLAQFTQQLSSCIPQDKPLLIQRICGHSALITKQLKQLASLPHLPDFVTDEQLTELMNKLPRPSVEQYKNYLKTAQNKALELGISAVSDMSLNDSMIQAWLELFAEGQPAIDVIGVVDAPRAPLWQNKLGPQLHKSKTVSRIWGRPTELKIVHWKKYLDGSLGSRTAWLSQAYHDQESCWGDKLQKDDAQLIKEAELALSKGFLLSFHAIGDAALDQAIFVGKTLGEVMKKNSILSGPHRLEHAQIVREDQLRELQSQNFWMLHLQPHHRVGDAGFINQRIGQTRLWGEAYRARGFLRHQLAVGLGSDAPIDELTPMKVIEAAMNHPNPEERLNFDDALWIYTTGSRLKMGLDPGQITAGSLVCLSQTL